MSVTQTRCPISFNPARWEDTRNSLGWTFRCLASGHAWSVGKSEDAPAVRNTQRLMDAHAATCDEKGA